MSSEENPCLRPVEAFPIDAGEGGQRIICLRDPMNVSQRIVGVPIAAVYILSLLDGTHSRKDIQIEFSKRTGQILPSGDLDKLIADLDESLMLDSAHFRAELERLERGYRESPLRQPTHIGGGYKGDVDELSHALESYFLHDEGPGEERRKRPPMRRLSGVIAPHIDYDRGGPSYAWAYAEVARDPADLYIILGTSHVPLSGYFSITRKHFGTPLGAVQTDLAFLDLLEETVGRPLETDALVHRSEHSVELQTVWLRHLLPPAARIAPILCGSLAPMIENGGSPMDDAEVSSFIEGLRQAIDRCGQRVVLIAAADLAHIGTGFGDASPPDDRMLAQVEEADRESMMAAVNGDAEEFFRTVQREKDRRRICGLSPIYAMVAALHASHGELLKYKQCIDPNGFRTVTIASAAFYS